MEYWLHGSEGTLHVSVTNGTLRAGKKGQELAPVEVPAVPVSDTVMPNGWRVEEEFVNAIRGTETVKLTSFEDGVTYMQFTDAVTEAMLSGGAVKVAAPVAP